MIKQIHFMYLAGCVCDTLVFTFSRGFADWHIKQNLNYSTSRVYAAK